MCKVKEISNKGRKNMNLDQNFIYLKQMLQATEILIYFYVLSRFVRSFLYLAHLDVQSYVVVAFSRASF